MIARIGNPPPQTERIIHDRLVEEIEETLPEGLSPKSDLAKTSGRWLFAFGALALSGLIAYLFVSGGWAAGTVGLIILFFYAFFGSTPWMAGRLRARDHREVELIVEQEIKTICRPVEPPGPA